MLLEMPSAALSKRRSLCAGPKIGFITLPDIAHSPPRTRDATRHLVQLRRRRLHPAHHLAERLTGCEEDLDGPGSVDDVRGSAGAADAALAVAR